MNKLNLYRQTNKCLGSLINISILLVSALFIVFDANAQESSKSISLFDGTSLQGWETVKPENEKYWTVKNGIITGGDGQTNIPVNTYLHTTKEYQDFEFRCLFRITGEPETGLINSGIQYRSFIHEGNIVGYQADIGNGYWGDIYDEHRRGKLIDGDLKTLNYLLDEDGWNSYIVRVIGDHHELYINGVKVAEYIEDDSEVPTKGIIGFQLHSGGNAKVEFRDILIENLK